MVVIERESTRYRSGDYLDMMTMLIPLCLIVLTGLLELIVSYVTRLDHSPLFRSCLSHSRRGLKSSAATARHLSATLAVNRSNCLVLISGGDTCEDQCVVPLDVYLSRRTGDDVSSDAHRGL